MSSPTIWSAGRYEVVAERIARIATEVIDAVERRLPVRDAVLVDLACGTGNAALAAAARGAQVTAVDITPELIAIGTRNAEAAGRSVAWVTADASDTDLPGRSFDAAVSNMGIIFVEPVSLVAEISRLLKPGASLGSRPGRTTRPIPSSPRSSRFSVRLPRRAIHRTSGVNRTRSPRGCRPASTTSASNTAATHGNSSRWTPGCIS